MTTLRPNPALTRPRPFDAGRPRFASAVAALLAIAATSCAPAASGGGAEAGAAKAPAGPPRAPATVAEWLADEARPLGSVEPGASLDDLEPLAAVVGGASVVGMGESVHHRHELLLLRLRALRFLIERVGGVRALALETGMAEAEGLNRWVSGEADGPPDFAAGLPFAGDGEFEELRAALGFLREHNARAAAGQKVRFYGIDLSHGGGALGPPLEGAFGYLEIVDPPAAAASRARLEPLVERLGRGKPATMHARYVGLAPADRAELGAALGELGERFARRRAEYEGRSSPRAYALAARLVEVARATEAFARAEPFGPDNPRDRAMAENVRWLLEREGGRLAVWAHNAHVQKAPIEIPKVTAAPAVSMGELLARGLGPRYVALGTAFDRAEADPEGADPESVDGALAAAKRPLFFVDLGRAPRAGAASTWLDTPRPMRFQGAYLRTTLRGAFDGLFFVERISPARRAARP